MCKEVTSISPGVAMVIRIVRLATDQRVTEPALGHVSSEIHLISPGIPQPYKSFLIKCIVIRCVMQCTVIDFTICEISKYCLKVYDGIQYTYVKVLN